MLNLFQHLTGQVKACKVYTLQVSSRIKFGMT
jgi:hypothetical protein